MTDTPVTSNTFPRNGKLNAARRRMLPAAASAAAAMTLAGCAMTGSSSEAPQPIKEAPAAQAVQQKNAEDMVRRYTESLDLALDRVDRERLRVAAEKKSVVPPAAVTPAPAAPAAPATPIATAVTPAAIPAAEVSASVAPSETSASISTNGNATAATASQSVLFATSTPESPDDHAAHAAPAAHVPAPAATPQPHAAVPPAPPVGTAVVSAPKSGAPAGDAHDPAAVSMVNATGGKSVLDKAMPAAPAAPAPAATPSATPARDAHAAPLSTQSGGTPAASIITPITITPGSTPAAMTSMTAAVPAAPVAEHAAAIVTTPISAPPAPVASPEPSMDDAMGVLRKKVAANPSLNSALALALLDPAEAQSADLVRSLPEADQKIFGDLLTALQGMNAPAGSTATAADRTAPIVNVARKWQADSDLSLPRLVLASRVDSFGVYNAVEAKFEQGRRQTVIIYCEVANFSSTRGDDNWYNTRLTQQETLVTDDGLNLLVWRSNPDDIEDRSLNQRRDFYLVKKLTIPENLAAGKYTLIMSVTDKNSSKHSTVNLPIEIVVK